MSISAIWKPAFKRFIYDITTMGTLRVSSQRAQFFSVIFRDAAVLSSSGTAAAGMTAAKATATAEATASGTAAAGTTAAEAAAQTARSAEATEAAGTSGTTGIPRTPGTSGTARTAAPSGTAKAPEEGTPCHAGEYHQKDDDDNHKENEI